MAETGKMIPTIAERPSHQCPADVSDVADLYLLDRLTPKESDAFEDHFLCCGQCANAVQLAYNFIATLKDSVSTSYARRGVSCEMQMPSRRFRDPAAGSAV